jgi:regulator of replication initiation timing
MSLRSSKSARSKLWLIGVLIIALIGTVLGWYQDRAAFVAELQKVKIDQSGQQRQMDDLVKQDADVMSRDQNLADQLTRETASTDKISQQWNAARMKFSQQEEEDSTLRLTLSNLRMKFDQSVSDESREQEANSKSTTALLDLREYVHGLYADDLALRQASNKAPYPIETIPAPTPAKAAPKSAITSRRTLKPAPAAAGNTILPSPRP